MKNSKLLFILGLIMFTSVGCQSTPCKNTTLTEMKAILEEGQCDNRVIDKTKIVALPAGVQRALRTDVSSPVKPYATADKRFDVAADKVPAKLFFLSLVQDTPFNITVHPEVDGAISLKLKKVTIFDVLEAVRNVYGFDYKQTAHGIEVLPATIQTRAFAVNYLDLEREGKTDVNVVAGATSSSGASNTSVATPSGGVVSSSGSGSSTQQITTQITTTTKNKFWEDLQKALELIVDVKNKKDRTVAVSKEASLVVIQAMPNELKKVHEFLVDAELTLNRQVIIEAKILEVELNEEFQAGINWALISGRARAAQFNGDVVRNGDPRFYIAQPEEVVRTIPGGARDASGNRILPFNLGNSLGAFEGVFALAFNYKNLASFVELLATQGNVQVLSSPRISTTNNQKALIKVGTDDFFVTNVSSSTTVVPGTTAAQNTPNVTFDSFFSGVALDVTPHISGNGYVTLHIHPRVSAVKTKRIAIDLGSTGGVDSTGSALSNTQIYPLASTNIRESDSIVRAKNGEMIVIGGLMQDQKNRVKTGIPVLKDIPGLGKIFRHTQERANKSELVILLRPIIVDNKTWTKEMDKEACLFKQLDCESQDRRITSTCIEEDCPTDCPPACCKQN